MKSLKNTSDYRLLLGDIKRRVRVAQVKASLSVNRELVLLYWSIGRDILARQQRLGWGAKVIDRLAQDLHRAFPDMKGFSPRNLKYMRSFAEAYPDKSFVQVTLAQITWYHNITLLQKVPYQEKRMWYVRQTVEHGWSRDALVRQIEGRVYERHGKAVTNFKRTLPALQSDLARQTLKDPYNFDFLMLGDAAVERHLERGLLEHLQDFLVELGVGFAFVGRQVRLTVGDQDFYIDLLFYHLRLRCYVVIDLKMKDFKPEDAGQMNFYLSAVDNHLRHAEDRPSIGLILCKGKNRLVAEYALRDMSKPIGVSAYKLTEQLPKSLKNNFPTIKDLEAELARDARL